MARYNGMSSRETLNEGQLISLPNRVSSQTKKENPTTPSRNNVNVTELASSAIDKATDQKTTKSNPKLENEPIRHKVSRGELLSLYQDYTTFPFDLLPNGMD